MVRSRQEKSATEFARWLCCASSAIVGLAEFDVDGCGFVRELEYTETEFKDTGLLGFVFIADTF